MILADIQAYFNTRLFWVLNILSLVLLTLYSLLMAGMDRIGLNPMRAYDYLISVNNTNVTMLMPLLICLFTSYMLASEYRWRTLMVPLFEGVSRTRIVLSKAVLCALVSLSFALIYLIGSLIFAFTLFSSKNMLLESHVLTLGEVVSRMAGAVIWNALIVFLFGLLSMILVVQFRNAVLATVGSFIGFIILLLTAGTRNNPLEPLFNTGNTILYAAGFDAGFTQTLLQGLATWLLLAGGLLALFWYLFRRQDIVLE